jgi:hypothetical protein
MGLEILAKARLSIVSNDADVLDPSTAAIAAWNQPGSPGDRFLHHHCGRGPGLTTAGIYLDSRCA